MNRIVLLGASNLTLGFPEIVDLTRRGLGPGATRVLAAAGHGRGYARPSLVLGRGLPPIATCGLWHDLEREPGLPTRALVADTGNDLAFGASVEETLAAVVSCLDRLAAAAAEITILLPPLDGVERLSRARFVVLRSILFPGRLFDQGLIVRRLRRLSGELRALAASTGARTAEPDRRWLGADGIHLSWRQRRAAWNTLLAGWPSALEPAAPPGRLRWSWRRAHRAALLGVTRQHRQPCRRFADGSTLGCY